MKTVGIITFHACHNYGSMLQNYAMQQVLKRLGYSPVTINYRTKQQKEQYSPFTPFSQLIDKKRIILNLAFSPFKKSLLKKASLFETFLRDELVLTGEVSSSDDLKGLPVYDNYLAGSDQCWNLLAKDFQWSYFLDFVSDVNKISYAVSMGPYPKNILNVGQDKKHKITVLLSDISAVSVRDKNTQDVIGEVTGGKIHPEILIDPTLLLNETDYLPSIHTAPIVKGKYIFLYNPYYLPEVYRQAKTLSEITGLRIVSSTVDIKSLLHYPFLERRLDVGPWEFLNLIKNAEFVIGRSFHLLAFAILLKKPVIAVNGMGDSRLGELLNLVGLNGIATSEQNSLNDALNTAKSIDYEDVERRLDTEREKSFSFLNESLK